MSNNQKRVKELSKEILHHNNLYYNNQPEISDADYDILVDELRTLHPDHPTLHLVGHDTSTAFSKVKHLMPMTSQNKASQPSDFEKWTKKMNYSQLIVQYKLDGISIELQYLNGQFKRGVTRGDGSVGDDITDNVLKMQEVPTKVNPSFSGAVRGEVLLFNSVFREKYSDQKNPRNTAAGIAKRKDGMGCEDLSIIVYDALNLTHQFLSESDKLGWLKSNGFKVVDTREFTFSSEVTQFRKEVMDTIRNELEYEIDGLVVKGEEIDVEDMKRAKPMKQIAYKFSLDEVITTVVDIEWSSSGYNYTPVAIVEPVEIAGTTVQRANLSNPDQIKLLGLKIGSKVIIVKRGEIVPKIERVILTPEDAKEITIPTKCVICGSNLQNIGTNVYCVNEHCPNKELHRLRRWITILGIKNFGEKMIEQLYNAGKLKKIVDFYTVDLI